MHIKQINELAMHPKSPHNQAPDLVNLDTNPAIKLGLAIRHQRKQQNKTLTQLADQIGTDAGNLSMLVPITDAGVVGLLTVVFLVAIN